MNYPLTWRHDVNIDDVIVLTEIAKKTNVFNTEEISVVQELITDKLNRGATSDYLFLVAEHAGNAIAFTCFGIVPLTDNRYDLYWIVVDPGYQRLQIGAAILLKTEKIISQQGGIHLYAETSGSALYHATRQFYDRNGYQKIAELPDYYRDGDAQVIYRKVL